MKSPSAKGSPAGVAIGAHSSPVTLPRRAALLTRLRRPYWLIPVALAVLFSANTLTNTFAAEDTQLIVNNVFLKDWRNLPQAFASGDWFLATNDISSVAKSEYRPMVLVWQNLVYTLVGTSTSGWHLSSLLLHAVVTFLLFVVFRRFTGRPELALLSASLFAVHPVHAEAVAWASGVADVLLALFLLPAFYAYLRYRERRDGAWLALAAVFFLFSLWVKEAAFALLLIIAYCELIHFKEREPLPARSRRLLWAGIAMLVPAAIYLLMRRQALGAWFSTQDVFMPLATTLATIPVATLTYLKLAVLPFGYSYQHYTPWVVSFTDVRFFAPLAALIAIAALVALSRSRLLRFAGVWLIALILPAAAGIGRLPVEYMVQDRTLYLASAGFCLAVALGVEWLTARLPEGRRKPLTIALISLLVLVAGVATIRQNRTWHDDVSVFTRNVAADPDSPYAHSALSTLYFSMGKVREAEAAARHALEINPQHINAYQSLSFFSKQFGKLDESIAYLEQARDRVPLTPLTRRELATLYLNLGLQYGEKKDRGRAEEHLVKSLDLWDRPAGQYYTGIYYFGQERYEEALPYYEKALAQLPPAFAPIRLSIAVVYEKTGQKEKAIAFYNHYLRLAPAAAPDRPQVVQAIQALQNPSKAK